MIDNWRVGTVLQVTDGAEALIRFTSGPYALMQLLEDGRPQGTHFFVGQCCNNRFEPAEEVFPGQLKFYSNINVAIAKVRELDDGH